MSNLSKQKLKNFTKKNNTFSRKVKDNKADRIELEINEQYGARGLLKTGTNIWEII